MQPEDLLEPRIADRIIGDCGRNCNPLCGPLSVYDYIDVVGFWLKNPSNIQELSWINGHVARPLRGKPFLRNRRARFNPSYCQYQRWFQPQAELLQWLTRRNDAFITYVEIARDFVPDDENEAQEMSELFCRSLVQHRHCTRETWQYGNGNGNSGDRNKGLTFSWYATRVSKITGEQACHLEARIMGSKVLRRYGIGNALDLWNLDHNAFWQGMWKRNIGLYVLDLERLGRYYTNGREVLKRKTPRIIPFCNYNRDKAVGAALFHSLGCAGNGHSVQGIIDRFGRGPFIKDEQCIMWEKCKHARTNARSYAPKMRLVAK